MLHRYLLTSFSQQHSLASSITKNLELNIIQPHCLTQSICLLIMPTIRYLHTSRYWAFKCDCLIPYANKNGIFWVYMLAFEKSIQINNCDLIKFYLKTRIYWYAFKGFVKTKHLSLYLLAAAAFNNWKIRSSFSMGTSQDPPSMWQRRCTDTPVTSLRLAPSVSMPTHWRILMQNSGDTWGIYSTCLFGRVWQYWQHSAPPHLRLSSS